MPSMVSSNGLGLSTAFTVSASAANDTDTPSLTSAAACLRFEGVIRFNAPISSSLPHRPQFDSSVFHRSYCASVTAWPERFAWACGLTDGPNEKQRIARRLIVRVFMVCLLHLLLGDHGLRWLPCSRASARRVEALRRR